jgi:hypothetical protein
MCRNEQVARQEEVEGEKTIHLIVQSGDIACYGLWGAIGLAAYQKEVDLDLLPLPPQRTTTDALGGK